MHIYSINHLTKNHFRYGWNATNLWQRYVVIVVVVLYGCIEFRMIYTHVPIPIYHTPWPYIQVDLSCSSRFLCHIFQQYIPNIYRYINYSFHSPLIFFYFLFFPLTSCIFMYNTKDRKLVHSISITYFSNRIKYCIFGIL